MEKSGGISCVIFGLAARKSGCSVAFKSEPKKTIEIRGREF
jgi:hypothetical protein